MINLALHKSTALCEEVRPWTHNSAVHRVSVVSAEYEQVGVFVALHETDYATVERAGGAIECEVPTVLCKTVGSNEVVFGKIVHVIRDWLVRI